MLEQVIATNDAREGALAFSEFAKAAKAMRTSSSRF
jgi:hypothetical protein